MRRVGIVGAGITDCRSRWVEATFWDLFQQATRRACEDAKITTNEIDSVVYGIYEDIFEHQAIPESSLTGVIGMANKPGVRVTMGGVTGFYNMRLAATEVPRVMWDVVLGIDGLSARSYIGGQPRIIASVAMRQQISHWIVHVAAKNSVGVSHEAIWIDSTGRMRHVSPSAGRHLDVGLQLLESEVANEIGWLAEMGMTRAIADLDTFSRGEHLENNMIIGPCAALLHCLRDCNRVDSSGQILVRTINIRSEKVRPDSSNKHGPAVTRKAVLRCPLSAASFLIEGGGWGDGAGWARLGRGLAGLGCSQEKVNEYPAELELPLLNVLL